MSQRNREAWEAAFGLLVLVGVVLLGIGVVETAVTEVSVPLLWPLAATAVSICSTYLVLSHRAADRRRIQAEYDQENEARRALVNRVTVASILGDRYRLTGERIGDAERDVFLAALYEHFAAGRLEQAELDERLAATMTAKTVADLRDVVRDLPDEAAGR